MSDQDRMDRGFEARAREVFDASVEGLDARTRSRLNQARQKATAEIERSRRSPWLVWAPAGAMAAAALLAVVLWRMPGGPAAPAQQAQVQAPPALAGDDAVDPGEVLAAGDDLDLLSEDLEFYDFVAYSTGGNGNGVG